MDYKTFNGLPLFNATINAGDDTGVYCVSFVTDPATEINFLAFEKQKKLVKYSIQDNKEHIVAGVIMVADTPIFRIDKDGFEYYIVYSKETLKYMAEKMLAQGFTSSVNIEHKANSYVDGVNLQQIYIIDKEKGLCPEYFQDVPDGSLIGVYKIHNPEVWEMVEKGEVVSFSLEGWFEMLPVIANKNKKDNKMSKITKFVRNLMKFGQLETDKGTIYFAEDEIAEGVEVFVDGENEKVVAEDGEYTLEDERVVVVKEGKVAEIREKEVEEEKPVEEPVEVEVEAEEETEVVVEEPAEPEPEERDVNAERIDALEKEVADLKGEIENIKAELAKIVSTPVVEPIEEVFEKARGKADLSGLPKETMKAIERLSKLKK